jgi:hypothetical protein
MVASRSGEDESNQSRMLCCGIRTATPATLIQRAGFVEGEGGMKVAVASEDVCACLIMPVCVF